MTTFEYSILDLNALRRKQTDLDALNEKGAEGWELVSISSINIALLKRKSSEADAEERPHDEHPVGFAYGSEPDEENRDQRRVVPIKYRDPHNPENTWTGRGRMPRWMTAAIAEAGARKEDFLISGDLST